MTKLTSSRFSAIAWMTRLPVKRKNAVNGNSNHHHQHQRGTAQMHQAKDAAHGGVRHVESDVASRVGVAIRIKAQRPERE